MARGGFQCPHCGTFYEVKTETVAYDPQANSAKCQDCDGVMAIWFFNVRPVFKKRKRLSPASS